MAKTVKFEDKMNRLQEIVEQLEKDNVNLDMSLKIYQEGLQLSKQLKDELSSYESKIEKLSKENKSKKKK